MRAATAFILSVLSAVVVAVVLDIAPGAQGIVVPVEWRYYGGDISNTKYSPVDLIRRDNVAQLDIAWRWTSPDNSLARTDSTLRPGNYQDTPLMANGVLYTISGLGIISAIDPRTGQTRWQFDPESWKAGRPPNLGYTHRGIAYWTDRKSTRLNSSHIQKSRMPSSA